MFKDPVLKQYTYETQIWRRLLAFFAEENVHFKIRLAEIVDNGSEKDILDNAEEFQESFLSQDKIICTLSDEIRQHSNLLQGIFFEDGILFKAVLKNQKKLRKEIHREEALFNTMKKEFSNYLTITYC